MLKYAKALTITTSFFILGSLAIGDPSSRSSLASLKKPIFKCSSSFSVTEELALSAVATAAPGYKNQVVSYSLVSGPSGMSINSSTGQLIWTPTHEQTSNPYSVYAATVKAFDASNTNVYATKDLKFKVIQVNTKPTVTCSTGINIQAGEKLLLQATGTDPDLGQKLKYSLSGAPSGATINSTSGLISWSTKASNAGSFSFKVVATDNGVPKLSANCPVSVAVTTANRAPSLAAIADKTATVGSALSFTASASDPDAGQTLSFSLSGEPSGATINASTGKFSWVPTSDQASAAANYSFTVKVTDSGSPALSAERTVKVALQGSSGTQTVGFTSKLGPLDNPMKGWAYFYNAEGTNSLLFTNVSWKSIEPSDGSYDFSAIDRYLNNGTNAGKHFVFRVYLDYPFIASGVPQWVTAKGVDMIAYGTPIGTRSSTAIDGYTPDYNNPVLVSYVTRLISKLGERYNGDPRVAYIQVGIMGQYGEWTTYRAGSTLRYSVSTQNAILDAFDKAFPDKKLQGRHAGLSYDPTSVSAGANYAIGYHDDGFPFNTYNVMLPSLAAKGKQNAWTSECMGGEIWPNREDLMLSDPYRDITISSTNSFRFSSPSQPFNSGFVGTTWRISSKSGFAGQDITITDVDSNGVATADKSLGTPGATGGTMQFIDETKKVWDSVYEMTLNRVNAFHPTFMLINPKGATGTRANSQAKLDSIARLMGYQFRLTSITLPNELKIGQDNSATINLVNEGVAPFYYKWKVYAALMSGDIVKQQIELPWDIRNWQPGSITQSMNLNPTVAAGTYDLAIKIDDPWSFANKAGIEFANTLRMDINGWTHLMQITVK